MTSSITCQSGQLYVAPGGYMLMPNQTYQLSTTGGCYSPPLDSAPPWSMIGLLLAAAFAAWMVLK